MSNREEIQITDLEPSIEGGDDVEYIVQVRGIDATGRPGPWSEELKFTSPQQIPSLESVNYVPGESGWKFDNDGNAEINGATFRGLLESANYVENVSGWRLTPDGFAEFGSGIFRGALRIGQNTFNVDTNGNLFIGGTSPQNAPFSVDTTGTILAMNIDAGFITAGTIGADVVYAGELVASQITSGTLAAVRIPNLAASKITSGTFDAVRIPNLSAEKITTGTMSADRISGGNINANNVGFIDFSGGNITLGTVASPRIATTLNNKTIRGRADGVPFAFQGATTTGINIFSNQLQVRTSNVSRGTWGTVLRTVNHNPSTPLGLGGANNLGSNAERWATVFCGNVNQSSDGTLKIFEPSDLGLDFVRELQPVRFRWKETNDTSRIDGLLKEAEGIEKARALAAEASGGEETAEVLMFDDELRRIDDEIHLSSRPGKRWHYGLIAQQVEEAVEKVGVSPDDFAPLAIDENGMYSLAYSEFIGPIILAIQELSDKIENIERKINGN